MELPPTDFESAASASSAIPALGWGSFKSIAQGLVAALLGPSIKPRRSGVCVREIQFQIRLGRSGWRLVREFLPCDSDSNRISSRDFRAFSWFPRAEWARAGAGVVRE